MQGVNGSKNQVDVTEFWQTSSLLILRSTEFQLQLDLTEILHFDHVWLRE